MVNGENIATVYNMLAYKLKVVNVENYKKSSLPYRLEISILGYKTTLTIILVLFFQMEDTCVAMVSMINQLLEEIT